MARWVTATLACLALCDCHPMRAALDHGQVREACVIAERSHVDEDDAERDQLHALLAAQVEVTWNIEPVSLVDLAPKEAVALATGLERLRDHPYYRITLEAKGLPEGADLLFERPTLLTPVHDERVETLGPRSFSGGVGDLGVLLRSPSPPDYEYVPPQSLPREYVEEREPGKWVYRGNVDPAQLTLAVVTAGLSSIFLGPDLGREADWVPASPAEKAAWLKLAPARRKAFEREEAARLAEGRRVVEAVIARNQATKARYEQELAALREIKTALTALVQTEGCDEDSFTFRLKAGHRCVLFATTADRGKPVIQPLDGAADLQLRGALVFGARDCSWRFKEVVPAQGDERIAQLAARVFSTGPRRLQPLRRKWTDFR